VRATAAGAALVRHARSILEQVEQMRGELRTYATGLKGRIRLLSNSAALAAFLPPQLCRFLATHRDLSIDLEERPSVDIVQALMDRRADLGIIADITDFAALQAHLIASDQLMVVASRSHWLARQAQVAFADILGEPVVGVAGTRFPPGPPARLPHPAAQCRQCRDARRSRRRHLDPVRRAGPIAAPRSRHPAPVRALGHAPPLPMRP
jgi:DNA-binding transcriptional LysR family regulator